MVRGSYLHDPVALDKYTLLRNSPCTQCNQSVLMDRTGLACIQTPAKVNTTTFIMADEAILGRSGGGDIWNKALSMRMACVGIEGCL